MRDRPLLELLKEHTVIIPESMVKNAVSIDCRRANTTVITTPNRSKEKHREEPIRTELPANVSEQVVFGSSFVSA